MKIHIIRTPEYPLEDFMLVLELLNNSRGPMTFIAHQKPWDLGICHHTNGIHSILKPLSFSQLFAGCDLFRYSGVSSEEGACDAFPQAANKKRSSLRRPRKKEEAVQPEDFVVLLTTYPNLDNWFSAFEGRNIFVHTADWDKYILAPHHVAVAFQIVENVIQSLMSHGRLYPLFPLAHPTSIGCLNDFCQKKSEIILKMRTADLCPACLKKFRQACPDMENVLEQAFSLLEFFRIYLLFRHGFRPKASLKPMKVDHSGRFYVGEKLLKLGYLEATIYLFFLLHLEGVALNEMDNHWEEWHQIYTFLNPHRELFPLEEMLEDIHTGGGRFPTTKTRLNQKIRKLLGNALAEYYVITGERGQPFKISLPREYLHIEPHFELNCQNAVAATNPDVAGKTRA